MGAMPRSALPGHRRNLPLRSALLASLLPLSLALSTTPLSLSTTKSSLLRTTGCLPAFVGCPFAAKRGCAASALCMSSRGRRKAQEGGPGKKGAGIGGPSGNMGVQRRHLGPTTEDLMSFRRAEKEQRLAQMAAMRASDSEGGALDDDLEDLDREASVEPVLSSWVGGESKRRHLGPTLEEIAEMRTQASASFGQSSHKEREMEFAPRAARAREPSEDPPTQVQLNALVQMGVAEEAWPATKAGASEMLREMREARLGNDLSEIKGPAVEGRETRHLSHDTHLVHEARDVVREYAPRSPQRVHGVNSAEDECSGASHLQYALKGISTIRRKGSVAASLEQLEP